MAQAWEYENAARQLDLAAADLAAIIGPLNVEMGPDVIRGGQLTALVELTLAGASHGCTTLAGRVHDHAQTCRERAQECREATTAQRNYDVAMRAYWIDKANYDALFETDPATAAAMWPPVRPTRPPQPPWYVEITPWGPTNVR